MAKLDENKDGLLSIPEAAPLYGGVLLALTTKGDTSSAVIYGSVALAAFAAAGGVVLTNRRRAATK